MNKNIINKILDHIDDEESFQKLYKIDSKLISKYFVKRFMNDDIVEYCYNNSHLKHDNKYKIELLEHNSKILKGFMRDKVDAFYNDIYECCKCHRLERDRDNPNGWIYCEMCNDYICENCCSISEEEVNTLIEINDPDDFCSKECVLKFIDEQCIKCKICSERYNIYYTCCCEICNQKCCENCFSDTNQMCDNCLNSSDHIYSNYGKLL